jgi:hypothetical protein
MYRLTNSPSGSGKNTTQYSVRTGAVLTRSQEKLKTQKLTTEKNPNNGGVNMNRVWIFLF